MKKAVVTALVVVLALLAASVARGDEAFSTNTCGLNGNPIGSGHTPGVDIGSGNGALLYFDYLGTEPKTGYGDWEASFVSNCGYGGTIEYELQHKVSGSFADMHEADGGNIDHQLTSPVVGDNRWDKTPRSLNACVHNDVYRLSIWWKDQAGNSVRLNWPDANGAIAC